MHLKGEKTQFRGAFCCPIVSRNVYTCFVRPPISFLNLDSRPHTRTTVYIYIYIRNTAISKFSILPHQKLSAFDKFEVFNCHMWSEGQELYEFAFCISWRGGSERWDLMSNTWSSKPKILWHKQNEIWFRCVRQGQI